MPYVDANKTLSDPRKIGRMYFILEPLLRGKDVEFKAKRKRCNKLLQDAKSYAKKPQIVGALKSYRYLNEAIYEKLGQLNLPVIFLTSESRSSEGLACVDIFSEHSELGDKILEVENELYAEFGSSKKQVLYFPVSPILFPAQTAEQNKEVFFRFPFPEVFEEVNARLPKSQQVSQVSLERRLNQDSEGQKGVYQFKTLLFNSVAAKKVFVEGESREDIRAQELELEDCTYVNRTLMGQAYREIVEKLKIEGDVPLYSEEGGYSAEIFDSAGIKRTTFGQVTRNLSGLDSRLGASSSSALRILKSCIYRIKYQT